MRHVIEMQSNYQRELNRILISCKIYDKNFTRLVTPLKECSFRLIFYFSNPKIVSTMNQNCII